MEKAYKRGIIGTFCVILMSLCCLAFGSCMESEDVEASPQCGIVSFSVGDIKSYVTTKKYDNKGNARDTIISKTISGKGIYFNIDQVNGIIFNVDSLPKWTNLTRVVPSFTAYGNAFVKLKENGTDLYYILTSGQDSLDFSNPVEIMSLASDGKSTKKYTVKINKHLSDIDTLVWNSANANLEALNIKRTYVANDKMFIFANDNNGIPVVSYTSKESGQYGTLWSAPTALTGAEGVIDANSIVLFNGAFYTTDSEGYIYKSTPGGFATDWTKVSSQKVMRILAADNQYLYAFDGNDIIGSKNMTDWTKQGSADIDMLPETCINYTSRPSKTNQFMSVVTMSGINNMNHRVNWFKMTSEEDSANEPWAFIQTTNDNAFAMPRFSNLSVTYYNNALCAIGMKDGEYDYIYRSEDNGITWHAIKEMYLLPEDLSANDGAATLIAVDDDLWIIQENGKVWLGSVR